LNSSLNVRARAMLRAKGEQIARPWPDFTGHRALAGDGALPSSHPLARTLFFA
jgi:hypothetical protein